MRLVCIKCGRLMKVVKNGLIAQENIDHNGEPYRLFSFDKWQCPECGWEVLAGHGNPVYPGTDEYNRWTQYRSLEVMFY